MATEDNVRRLIYENVVAKLDDSLRVEAAKRSERPFSMGAWNVGSCPRKNWLLARERPEDLQPRSLLTFDAGNATENWVLDRLEQAGVPLVRADEKKDTFDLPPIGRMRPDAFIDIGGEHIVIDVKSMSNYSFERAQSGDVDFSYRAQLLCYEKGLSLRWGALFCVRKETSHLDFTTNVVGYSDAEWQKVLDYHAMATGATIPPRPYKLASECEGVSKGACFNGRTPTGKQDHKHCGGTGLEPGGPFIPSFPCGYCPVKRHCWPGLEEVITPGKPPRWRSGG